MEPRTPRTPGRPGRYEKVLLPTRTGRTPRKIGSYISTRPPRTGVRPLRPARPSGTRQRPLSVSMLEHMSARSTPLPSPFAGFASPNFTQVPDELFDVLMPLLSEAELRVLLYIIRRTFGFKRDSDTISLSQMVSGITTRDVQVLDSGTGLSKATVARGLQGLRTKGVIIAARNRSASRGDEPTTYRLHFQHAPTERPREQRPVSQSRDTPRVSHPGQALSQPRDTQETGEQETVFEYSKGEHLTQTGSAHAAAKQQDHNASHPDLTASSTQMTSLAMVLRHRVRRDVGHDDRTAITLAVERFAGELGDKADLKVSVSRALNLYQSSGVHRDAFIDVLFQAKGEVQDRRNYPGKAPVPRNRMAYFFAVVEDQLGLRHGDGKT